MGFFESLAEAVGIPPEEAIKRFEQLDPREREIMAFRIGFDDGVRRTLEECGEAFNLTRERIRQIESRAMARLRHPKR